MWVVLRLIDQCYRVCDAVDCMLVVLCLILISSYMRRTIKVAKTSGCQWVLLTLICNLFVLLMQQLTRFQLTSSENTQPCVLSVEIFSEFIGYWQFWCFSCNSVNLCFLSAVYRRQWCWCPQWVSEKIVFTCAIVCIWWQYWWWILSRLRNLCRVKCTVVWGTSFLHSKRLSTEYLCLSKMLYLCYIIMLMLICIF